MELFRVMEMFFVILMVVLICLCIGQNSENHTLKFLFVNYTSINMKNKSQAVYSI